MGTLTCYRTGLDGRLFFFYAYLEIPKYRVLKRSNIQKKVGHVEAQDLQKEIYQFHAQVCQALSHPKRLEILDLLSEGEKSLEGLSHMMGVSKANVSQHLSLMRQNNLLRTRKEGLRVFYRVANPKLLQAWAIMREVALEQVEAIGELMQAVRGLKGIQTVEELTLAQLMQRLEQGDVVLLDVRPSKEYEKGHIPGALSFPLEKIEQHWKKLPRDKELVAYCRGPYCTLSFQAIQWLGKHGVSRVKKLNVGYPEWQQAGFPVEKRRMQ